MILPFDDSIEITLQTDGSLAGPDFSKDDKRYFYATFLTIEPIHNDSENIAGVYYKRAIFAMKTRTENDTIPNTAYNVHVQAVWSDKYEGYIYAVIGEVEKMIPHFKDTLEVKLLEDGTLAGPDKSKEGRPFCYTAVSIDVPIKDMSADMINVYFSMFMMAMKNKSQIMWNVHTQSLVSENKEGYLYCVIGEMGGV